MFSILSLKMSFFVRQKSNISSNVLSEMLDFAILNMQRFRLSSMLYGSVFVARSVESL